MLDWLPASKSFTFVHDQNCVEPGSVERPSTESEVEVKGGEERNGLENDEELVGGASRAKGLRLNPQVLPNMEAMA